MNNKEFFEALKIMEAEKGIPAEFMITFDKKAKMGLNLILSEGGRK